MSYRIFKRRWWKDNPDWPNGLEPDPSARKTHICYADTEDEARRICWTHNNDHDPGRYSVKYEYEERS